MRFKFQRCIVKKYDEAVTKFEKKKDRFLKDQQERNNAILKKRDEYQAKSPSAIVDYCEIVLSRSEYPDFFPQEFDFEYLDDSGHLIVDYSLPAPAVVPRTKEYKYVLKRNEIVDVEMSDREFNALYDKLIYQVALRTIHELFEADVIDKISMMSFNGFVTSIDNATGHETTKCILSLQVSKEQFQKINLSAIDSKACFRSLKGIASSQLHSVTAIAPLASINKEDQRFVEGYAVAGELDDSINIAAMDWQDFENLIREIFEKEFQMGGGEVRITQASRDGGVDAVAFDPDPIRGGKIVIQAKRYTNTVGVSAVRDLYGTVMNEGATKGILVTTADYGPDAYNFAKDKPLTLLNGGNLLHLLEKHGHKAKIDLKSAKKELGLQ